MWGRRKGAAEPAVPQDTDLERHVVGGILLTGGADLDEILRVCQSDDIVGPLWRAAFEAIARRHADGRAVDAIAVARDVCDERGGAFDPLVEGDLIAAVEAAPMSHTIPALAQRLGELGLRRRAIQAAGEIAAGFYDLTRPVTEATEAINALYEDLDRRMAVRESGSIVDAHAELARNDAHGWPTGLDHLDGWLGGLVAGRTTVVSGPTGACKTWLITGLSLAAARATARTAIFTLEMSPHEMVVRLAANMGFGAAAFRLLKPEAQWADEDRAMYWEVGRQLSELPLAIFARQRTPVEIAAQIRTGGFDVAVIDYLQVMDWPSELDSEYEQMRYAGQWVFGLGRRSGCHMIAVSQLNTASVRLGKADPTAGLRGGGKTAEVADAILRLHPEEQGTMTLSVVKNRWGPDRNNGGQVEYRMDKQTGRLVPIDAAPTWRGRVAGGAA